RVEPERGVGSPARGQNRRAILYRYAYDFGSIVCRNSKLVSKSRGDKTSGAGRLLLAVSVQQVSRGIGDAGDACSGLAIKPFVGDDPGLRRPRAGHHRGMTRRGVGRSMFVVRVCPDRPVFQQTPDAVVYKQIAKSLEIVVAEL